MLQTFFAYNLQRAGHTIYSSYPLNFPHVLLRSPQHLLEISDGICLIDELHLYLDSRLFGSKESIALTHWITLTRHYGLSLLATTQVFGQVDIRFRDNCDYLIASSSIGKVASRYDIYDVFLQKKLKTFLVKRDPFIFSLFDSHQRTYENANSDVGRRLIAADSKPVRSGRSKVL